MIRFLKLRRGDGFFVEEQPHVKNVVVGYFQDLLAVKDGVYAPVIDTLSSCISAVDNDDLVKPFEKEFRCALMHMDSDKTPGPNGFNPGFYKRFWG